MSELDDVIKELEITEEHAAMTASKLSKKIIQCKELEAQLVAEKVKNSVTLAAKGEDVHVAVSAMCRRDKENQKLREALLGLNAAIDYHWNDHVNVTQRMPDAHAKMIEAAQQIAKQALKGG